MVFPFECQQAVITQKSQVRVERTNVIKYGLCFHLPRRNTLFCWLPTCFFLDSIELCDALDGLFRDLLSLRVDK